jgi:hypothetical protein
MVRDALLRSAPHHEAGIGHALDLRYTPREVTPMAGHRTNNGNHLGLAPDPAPAAAEYERDFYSWLMEQARHGREGRWGAVDRAWSIGFFTYGEQLGI